LAALALAACGRSKPGQWVVTQRILDDGLLTASGPVDRSSAHGDDRRSLRLTAPGSARFRARVPAQGLLSFGVLSRPLEAKLTLRLRQEPSGKLLHEESWTDQRPWVDHRIDLSAVAGKTTDLQIEVQGTAGAEVGIGEPVVLGSAPPRPNAIVYVIDCLRADRVGAYAYARPTTPEIDKIAASSYLFDDVHACATWTKPAVGCIFTGLDPIKHGARTVDDGLATGHRTLAEELGAAGYATAAWVANPVLDGRGFGYARGFDRYVELAQKWKGRAANDVNGDAAEITEGVLPWLEANRDGAFFLYLHSIDLHYPYDARRGFESLVREDRDGLALDSDLYESELAYNDNEIGKLMAALRRLGLDKTTHLVITADHGEEFGEHGTTRHGHSVYEELLHIPLLWRPPGGVAGVKHVTAAVGEIDMGPTLLSFLGVKGLAGAEGIDARGAMEGKPLPRPRLFAEQISAAETLYSIREGPLKLIRQLRPEPREMLFDLKADPREGQNLVTARRTEATALEARLLPFEQAGQEGRHLILADPPRGGTLRVEVGAEGKIVDVVRLVVRTGDHVEIAADGHRAELTIGPKNASREYVIRTAPPRTPLTVRLFDGPRRLPASALVVGRKPGPKDALAVRAWLYEVIASGSRSTVPPELREQMRALGYLQ
jgi:arylsulfatase A-like enzyme